MLAHRGARRPRRPARRRLARDVADDSRHHENPLGGFKPKASTAGVEILDELREVNGIATAKASPEDAAAFRAC